MPLDMHALYRQIFKIWRERRLAVFLRLLKPQSSDILLDVGGYPDFWLAHPPLVGRIDTLNVHEAPPSAEPTPGHHIRAMIGDGCALAFPDASYDIGFSNSVIEHVGSWERQEQFAAEIRRVGKALWVQTPAYECPIEPHYLTPFVHYFPRAFQKSILRWCTVWGWLQRPTAEQINSMVEETRLLKKAEMRQLFPDCEIMTERLLWLIPKSYVAIRHSNQVSHRPA